MTEPAISLTVRERTQILLAEYDALYGLVTFRMTSLDRRAPVAGATLAAFLAAITTLARPAQHMLLTGLPVASVWFLRTTINHARSFEDVLRRIDEIERHVNRLAAERLLAFQSRHPSRLLAKGGRTGAETVLSVLFACSLMLAACAYVAAIVPLSPKALALTWVYCGLTWLYELVLYARFRRYRYVKRRAPPIRPSKPRSRQ